MTAMSSSATEEATATVQKDSQAGKTLEVYACLSDRHGMCCDVAAHVAHFLARKHMNQIRQLGMFGLP